MLTFKGGKERFEIANIKYIGVKKSNSIDRIEIDGIKTI